MAMLSYCLFLCAEGFLKCVLNIFLQIEIAAFKNEPKFPIQCCLYRDIDLMTAVQKASMSKALTVAN
jgi:hypothetical protein